MPDHRVDFKADTPPDETVKNESPRANRAKLDPLQYDPDKIDRDRESTSFLMQRAAFDRESLEELLKILNTPNHESH